MKIKRLNESLGNDVSDILKIEISPLSEELGITHFDFHNGRMDLSFRIFQIINDENVRYFKELFSIFSRYDLKWYLSNNGVCYVKVDKYNNKMKIKIDANKYNIWTNEIYKDIWKFCKYGLFK